MAGLVFRHGLWCILGLNGVLGAPAEPPAVPCHGSAGRTVNAYVVSVISIKVPSPLDSGALLT